MANDEFYIGWLPNAPAGFARQLKKVLLVLAVFVLMAGIILALAQKKFSTGTFEFGKLTEVKGAYFDIPFPRLKVINGKDIFGRASFITIPLIGNGKSGANTVIAKWEKQKGVSLDGRMVTIRGTLLYNDGKLLMQVDEKDAMLADAGGKADASLLPVSIDKGEQQIKGEIVDPKCYFGVMKPGEGKPHKDCAIRCILGGIPPILKVTDEKGNQNYFLLAGPHGEKVNEAVRDFVSEPITVTALVVLCDDWIVLYVKENGIARYSYLTEHFGDELASCGSSCAR